MTDLFQEQCPGEIGTDLQATILEPQKIEVDPSYLLTKEWAV